MVDGFTQSFPEERAREYAEAVLASSRTALGRAVAAISPEQPDADPLSIFPEPGERRADDPGLELSPDQETELRSAAAELGFGRESDRTLSELGLRGAHVIIEGGQPHKMVAEAQLVLEDEAAAPTTLIFSASPNRSITSEDERASAERLLGKASDTEYLVAQDIATSLPGFETADADGQVLPYGYDIQDNFRVINEPTGQFILMGYVGRMPVVLMRIDRENYTDQQGDTKYRRQPGTADVIGIVDEISSRQDDDLLPVAFVTSATYQPSREVDAVRIALKTGRITGVPTYGTARLAAVKGTETPEPAPINQLPGELHKLALQVAQLESVVRSSDGPVE